MGDGGVCRGVRMGVRGGGGMGGCRRVRGVGGLWGVVGWWYFGGCRHEGDIGGG